MKFKLKFIYKVLIVLAVFIGALIFFSGGIKETIFGERETLVDTKESTLPIIMMEVEGNRMNLLRGYAANLDEALVRESITPLTGTRTFSVIINENNSTVRKLKYEIFNLSGETIEEGNFTVLDSGELEKQVDITLKEPLDRGKEYIAKITLITNSSKRVYYYTRLKYYEDGNIDKKLEFVQYVHNGLINRDSYAGRDVEKYLEPKRGGDRTTLAHVDITSPLDMVYYGKLSPQVIFEAVPTFTEFYAEMASVRLDYVLKVDTEEGQEFFYASENFRFNYTDKRTYLYNYERNMDALFDEANFNSSRNEFKLGITNDTSVQTLQSENKEFMAFVYGNELMVYDIKNNKLNKAFSFRNGASDFTGNFYDCHKVKLLSLDDKGNADFCVYGYMNRGEYEGRVGIVLYRYEFEQNAKAERLYVPINSSYQVLLSDMTEFTHISEAEIFYFSIYDMIYAYNLISAKLEVVATDVPAKNLIYCEEEKYLAWQDNSDDMAASKIILLDLENGEKKEIKSSGDTIKLLGRINNNIIFGCSRLSDTEIKGDGSREIPMYVVRIANGSGDILKEYNYPGNYITGIDVQDNLLILERAVRTGDDKVAYTATTPDTILNRFDDTVPPVAEIKHVTDRMLTEYFVSVPGDIEVEEIKKASVSKNVVINHETTLRVSEPGERQQAFYTYAFGEIVCASASAGEAILAADAYVGTVIDRSGRVIWERGIKASRYDIKDVTTIPSGENLTSVEAGMKMLALYAGVDLDTDGFSIKNEAVADCLSKSVTGTIDLSGANLSEVLYFVYRGQPVLGIRKSGNGCVILGYDMSMVIVYEPVKKTTSRISISELSADFEAAGNKFFSVMR